MVMVLHNQASLLGSGILHAIFKSITAPGTYQQALSCTADLIKIHQLQYCAAAVLTFVAAALRPSSREALASS